MPDTSTPRGSSRRGPGLLGRLRKDRRDADGAAPPAATAQAPAGGVPVEPHPPQVPGPAPELDPGPEMDEVLAAWREELAVVGGRPVLVDDRPAAADPGLLDLAPAHPSGLAQFWAGRATPLSSLFRDPAVHAGARHRVRALRTAGADVVDQHGVDPAALAVGLVRWQAPALETPSPDPAAPAAPGPAAAGRSAPVEVHAPAFLQSIALQPTTPTGRGGGSQLDEELALSPAVRLNPELVRLLAERGHALDVAAVLRPFTDRVGDAHRRGLAELRARTAQVPGLRLSDRAVVGLYLDLAPSLVADVDALAPALTASPLVRALAGTAAGRPAGGGAVPGATAAVWGATPDPVLDLDEDQRAVLTAVTAGRSVRVQAPPGTGATQLAAQVLVSAAAAGRRCLLVAPQRGEVDDVRTRLDAVGLGAITGPGALTGSGTVPAPSTSAAAPEDVAPGPASDVSGEELLRRGREALLAGHRSLHEVDPRLGVSGAAVLHQVGRLAGLADPPRTTVRLRPQALGAAGAHGLPSVVEQVRTAARLGAFQRDLAAGPWHGAALGSAQEAREARGRAERLLVVLLPELRARVRTLGERTGLAEPRTLAAVEERLGLLVDVRTTLDAFLPAVHQLPLADLVSALAPDGPWRARRRAQKEVLALQRPGHRSPDLRAELRRADAERRAWGAASVDGGAPRVPSGIPEVQRALAAVQAEVGRLAPVLRPTAGGGDLRGGDLDALQARMRALSDDRDALGALPERVGVLVHLAWLGLGGLVDDLAEREVEEDVAGAEVELAWWSSALVAILDDGWLRPLEPGRVHEARARLAAGRQRQVVDTSSEVLSRLPASGPVVRCASPLTVPLLHAPGSRTPARSDPAGGDGTAADVVLVLGAHAAGLAESVLSLVRAPQVVLVGDPVGPAPLSRVVSPDEGPAAAGRAGVWAAAQGALEGHVLTHQHRMPRQLLPVVAAARRQGVETSAAPGEEDDTQRAVPAPPGARTLVRDLVGDGTGQPSAQGVVHSLDAEVERVVAVVADHARRAPQASLAVLAVTREHARRVADALRDEMAASPDLRGYLARRVTEPFVVTDLSRAEGCVRDVVVLATAYGRTSRGRALHSFGPLDAVGGERALACAATRARRRLHVVTCLSSQDLGLDRLRTPGARALRDLLEAVEAAPADADADADADAGTGTGTDTGTDTDTGEDAQVPETTAVHVPAGGDTPSRALVAHAGPRTGLAAEVADPLLATLVQRLLDAGARVRRGDAGDPDLVVVDARDRGAGLLVDAGPEGPLEQVARAQALRGRGWAVVHVGDLELLTDLDVVVARVLDALVPAP